MTTAFAPNRTQLTIQELMARWSWEENDVRDAIINQGLVPSIFVNGVVWEHAKNASENRETAKIATQVSEWMYLLGVRKTASLDCTFDFYARASDALTTGGAVFKRDKNSFVDARERMSDVVARGCVMASQFSRFENIQQPKPNLQVEGRPTDLSKPLEKRERETLLKIIAVLCKESNLNYKTHSKTAGLIQAMADKMGISIGDTTIEGHLKKICEVVESRPE